MNTQFIELKVFDQTATKKNNTQFHWCEKEQNFANERNQIY